MSTFLTRELPPCEEMYGHAYYSFSMASHSSLLSFCWLPSVVAMCVPAFVQTRRVLKQWHAFFYIGIVHTFTAEWWRRTRRTVGLGGVGENQHGSRVNLHVRVGQEPRVRSATSGAVLLESSSLVR